MMQCMGWQFTIAGLFVYAMSGHSTSTAAVDPNDRVIKGTVVDATPDLSEKRFAKLTLLAEKWSKQAEQAFEQELLEMHKERPAPKVTVTASSGETKRSTVTDANGNYAFHGLPIGYYEIVAEGQTRASGSEERRAAMAWRRIEYHGGSEVVDLAIRGDQITITGRVTDAQGRPVGGAKVRGSPDPMPETSEGGRDEPWRPTVTPADGTYEIQGIAPPDLWLLAGYLRGGNPTFEKGNPPFFVDLRVTANGFAEGKVRVPIVTGDLAAAGRRYLRILCAIDPLIKSGGQEKEPSLPASTHNTITGIDVMLKEVASERK